MTSAVRRGRLEPQNGDVPGTPKEWEQACPKHHCKECPCSGGVLGTSRFWGSVPGFLTPYPKTSAGDPGGHGNRQRDPHLQTGLDAGRGGGPGSGNPEQFDGSDF